MYLTQLKTETTYLEATRLYRNYQTTKDEIGRPNPLLVPTSTEATQAELHIDRAGMKYYLSSPLVFCKKGMCSKACIQSFGLFPGCCIPCICVKMMAARDKVDQAVDAHTFVLREKTLYYKVTPYDENGLVHFGHYYDMGLNPICCWNCNPTSTPGTSERALGFDGFIRKPTGLNVNLEQAFPLELIDEIILREPMHNVPFSSLILHLKIPNFNRVKVVQIDMPLNGVAFVEAVMTAKKHLVESHQTIEHTNPALFREFVKYMASMKKVKFADWQAVHGGVGSATTPMAVAVEVAPATTDMLREMDKNTNNNTNTNNDRNNESSSHENTLARQLKELKELFDAGALTAEEFTAAKQSTLTGTGSTKQQKQQKQQHSKAPSAPSAPPVMLPFGWEEVVQEETGQTYYYNEKTEETTWDRPTN